MLKNGREIVEARRSIPAQVVDTLTPLEQLSHSQVVAVSDLKTLLYASHARASLPIGVGEDVFELVNETAYHAEQARLKLGRLHAALLPIVNNFFGNWLAGGPSCPPNDGMVPRLQPAQ